jgi:hypothetical protein
VIRALLCLREGFVEGYLQDSMIVAKVPTSASMCVPRSATSSSSAPTTTTGL